MMTAFVGAVVCALVLGWHAGRWWQHRESRRLMRMRMEACRRMVEQMRESKPVRLCPDAGGLPAGQAGARPGEDRSDGSDGSDGSDESDPQGCGPGAGARVQRERAYREQRKLEQTARRVAPQLVEDAGVEAVTRLMVQIRDVCNMGEIRDVCDDTVGRSREEDA